MRGLITDLHNNLSALKFLNNKPELTQSKALQRFRTSGITAFYVLHKEIHA